MLFRSLLILSTAHHLSLSSPPSFLSIVIGPCLDPSSWCNITQNLHFRMPFCKVLSPFASPKPCQSVASSFTLKTLLSCLTTSLPPYSSKGCHLRASPMPAWIAALIVGSVESVTLGMGVRSDLGLLSAKVVLLMLI